MKIRSDIIKVYKDVHIWIGIVSGLMLFIAFYAGSVTMFEKPLERWATPPSTLSAAPSLQQADALFSFFELEVAAHAHLRQDAAREERAQQARKRLAAGLAENHNHFSTHLGNLLAWQRLDPSLPAGDAGAQPVTT